MATVEMIRVSIVGPMGDRAAALEAVQDAGVLDVREGEEPASPGELTELRARVVDVLATMPPEDDTAEPESEPEPSWPGPEEAQARMVRVERARDEHAQTQADVEQREQAEERLEAWGHVDPRELRALEQHGVRVQIGEGPREALADFDPDVLAWSQCIERPGRRVRLIAISEDPGGSPLLLPLPTVDPPTEPWEQRQAELRRAREQLQRRAEALADAQAERPVLEQYRRWLDDRIAWRAVHDRIESTEPVFVLRGYCPRDALDRLRATLEAHALVLVTEPVADTDDVPVALRNGPLVRLFEPLVAAFKLPRHDERDPTPLLAPFMGLFFGLCLGDLGYGAVLTGIAGGLLLCRRLTPSARQLLRLALALGIFGMVMGALLGNLFGLRIHAMLGLSPSALLFSLVEDPRRFMAVALGLGVIQLSFGMTLRLVTHLRRRRFQHAVGSLAWLMVIPAVALPFAGLLPWWPLGLVCLALLLFAAPQGRLLHRLGKGAWAVYDITGVLANVVSYTRLFGLGLSSGIIAMVVNTIAATLANGSLGTLGLVAAVLTLVLGHAFNFAMAVIGSVVHPARLQLLEFFNTFFEGTGRAYAPLRRTFTHGKG